MFWREPSAGAGGVGIVCVGGQQVRPGEMNVIINVVYCKYVYCSFCIFRINVVIVVK